MLRTLRFPLTGCSSDWQSAAFGTQKSLVQIQSPRLSFNWRRIRLAFVGGVVAAAAVGASTSASEAENVAARGEIVAREAPGSGQAGIAVLRGSDRVQLLGQRDGWSEILLRDGRRAWIPTAEVVRVAEASRPTDDPTPVPSPSAEPRAEPQAAPHELASEIDRLRRVTDDLTTWRTNLPNAGAPTEKLPDVLPWAVGAAFVAGILIGAAFERRRNRRDRSLKF